MGSRRVFILEKNNRYNISSANKFGEIIYINTFSCEKFNVFSPNKAIKIIRDKLNELHFDHRNDIICLTGNSTLLALFLSVAFLYLENNCFDGSYELKILIFDAKTSNYKLRTLNYRD
jgi:hypothetical protein